MDEITVHVQAEVNPTETEEKVKQAVANIFDNVMFKARPLRKKKLLVAEGKGRETLTKFCNLLRRERIRSAARTVFFDGIEKKTVNFCLNKQVAFAGHVSFSTESGESPLGPIRVRIECEEPRQLIDWLAPRPV
jgi:predicted RNA binding protein with dsRBD fold (UPF0201 family)